MHIDQSYKYSYSDGDKILVHKDTGEIVGSSIWLKERGILPKTM